MVLYVNDIYTVIGARTNLFVKFLTNPDQWKQWRGLAEIRRHLPLTQRTVFAQTPKTVRRSRGGAGGYLADFQEN